MATITVNTKVKAPTETFTYISVGHPDYHGGHVTKKMVELVMHTVNNTARGCIPTLPYWASYHQIDIDADQEAVPVYIHGACELEDTTDDAD